MSSVIFFHNVNDYTGSTRVLADVISSDYSNKQVTIIVNKNKGRGFLSSLPNVRMIGIWRPLLNGHPIPLLTGQIVRIHGLILALIFGWRYDIFFINTVVPFYAAIVGQLYGKKIIYHVHEKFVRNSTSVKIIEWVFNHTKAHRIFVSKYTKDCYPDNPSCSSEVRYNRLGNDFLRKVSIKFIEERHRNTVLMIASLSKVKGIPTFLKVAELLPNLSFRLMISSDMKSIKAFIGNSIPDNVELIPAQSNIHPYLRDADLLLNLSNPFFGVETFGMTILEAMAYGIPSIVPNVGGPIELIEDGYNGYCVDVTDPTIVSSKIEEAFEPVNYERLVNNSFMRFDCFK